MPLPWIDSSRLSLLMSTRALRTELGRSASRFCANRGVSCGISWCGERRFWSIIWASLRIRGTKALVEVKQEAPEWGTMLQPRKHPGKATSKSPRDHRMWKAVSPKGLCEIKEIEKEEVSIKMMHSLERFMRSYPEVWSESSVQHLLVEIADTQYAHSGNSEVEERLHTIIRRMLVPMAKIMEAEQGSMTVERQKIQEATLALQKVQEECHHALVDLTKDHNRSSRDLKELGKALEENRLAAKEAGRKLAEKEKQIYLMLQKQRDLVVRLVCGGPSEFLQWAREEIQSQGLVDLDKELEQSWRVSDHNDDNKMLNPMPASGDKPVQTLNQYVYEVDDKSSFPAASLKRLSIKLPCLMVSETLRQMEESYGRMKGPLSLPSAVAGFWMGLAGRMTCLALVTLFPQVMQKSASTTKPAQLQASQL